MRPEPGSRVVPMMKKSVGLFGLIGLLGCFLPLALGVSWFDLRSFDSAVYLVMLGYAIPTVVGFSGRSRPKAAGLLVSLLGLGYIAVKFGFDTFRLFTHTSIGGIMMGVGLIGGIVATIAALADSGKD